MMIDIVFLHGADRAEPMLTLHGIIDIAMDCHTGAVLLSARRATTTHWFTLSTIHTALAIANGKAIMLDIVGAFEFVQRMEQEPLFQTVTERTWVNQAADIVIDLSLKLHDNSMARLMSQHDWQCFDYDLFKMLVSEMQMTDKDAIAVAFMEDEYVPK
jgi:hypothetical protein